MLYASISHGDCSGRSGPRSPRLVAYLCRLIIREDDDLKARSELRGLEFVLRDSYAVTTRLISIPSREYVETTCKGVQESHRTFEREINGLIRYYSAPDILLLVVYLGHGIYDEDLKFTLSGFR